MYVTICSLISQFTGVFLEGYTTSQTFSMPCRSNRFSSALPLENLPTPLCFLLQEAPSDSISSTLHYFPSGAQCLGQVVVAPLTCSATLLTITR